MEKIDQAFIIRSYRGGIDTYVNATTDIGLWSSEKYVIATYFNKRDNILDLGCGAGRTTHAMAQLGYSSLVGVDLNPDMVLAARSLGDDVDFLLGDATNLQFGDAVFDAVLFSFNGIMTIPGSMNRHRAFLAVYRVLQPGGIFVITTHDREQDSNFFEFWEEEILRWEQDEQDPRLFELGDLVTFSQDVNGEIYIHIPTRAEVTRHWTEAGFELVEEFWRPDRFNEREAVKAFSGDCRFWIVKKPSLSPSRLNGKA